MDGDIDEIPNQMISQYLFDFLIPVASTQDVGDIIHCQLLLLDPSVKPWSNLSQEIFHWDILVNRVADLTEGTCINNAILSSLDQFIFELVCSLLPIECVSHLQSLLHVLAQEDGEEGHQLIISGYLIPSVSSGDHLQNVSSQLYQDLVAKNIKIHESIKHINTFSGGKIFNDFFIFEAAQTKLPEVFIAYFKLSSKIDD